MTEGPYSACNTSKDYEPRVYGISGPGNGLGYYAWLLFPENTFERHEDAEKVARMMNLAFAEGQRDRAKAIAELLK